MNILQKMNIETQIFPSLSGLPEMTISRSNGGLTKHLRYPLLMSMPSYGLSFPALFGKYSHPGYGSSFCNKKQVQSDCGMNKLVQ